ncbi:MAG: cupin domain-containing protein [Cyanobacteriota bacterium]
MAISPFPQGLCPGDAVSTPAANWQDQSLIYDYRQAANPIRPGLTDPIPHQKWSAPAWEGASSRIVPLDLSAALGCDGPATSPGLAAHFLQVCPGDPLSPQALATSSLFYVCSGRGRLAFPVQSDPLAGPLEWAEGDVFVLPHGFCPELSAEQPSLLYWVHDAPLLRYLGVSPVGPRFSPCYFSADRLDQDLNQLLADPSAARSNRLSVLLAHADLPATRTVTHTLWAMLGVVPPGAVQAPHRHQSVAIDLIVACSPGCYTLVGSELDAAGEIRNPTRIDWESGGVFITPPGQWHAHVNNSGEPARLLPIQDAGLHTYLRSLAIRFSGGLTSRD